MRYVLMATIAALWIAGTTTAQSQAPAPDAGPGARVAIPPIPQAPEEKRDNGTTTHEPEARQEQPSTAPSASDKALPGESPTESAAGTARGHVPALEGLQVNADGAVIAAPGKRELARAVGVLSAGDDPNATRMLGEMADALANEPIKILPVIGRGPIPNVVDMIQLDGIDFAVLPADVLTYLEAEGVFLPQAKNVIRAVGRLYDEEFHLLARRKIGAIQKLAGQRVAIDVPGSASFITAQLVFGLLGVQMEPVAIDPGRALEQLRKGDIAAMVLVARKPARLFHDLNVEDQLHFLPVSMTPSLRALYAPAQIRPADYPLLIRGGEAGRGRPIATLSVGRVLAVYNWAPESDRFPAVQAFVEAITRNLPTLKAAGRSPDWREANFAQPVPGWPRYAGLDAPATTPAQPAGAAERER